MAATKYTSPAETLTTSQLRRGTDRLVLRCLAEIDTIEDRVALLEFRFDLERREALQRMARKEAR